MSSTGATSGSRGSYFDLYPERKPKPSASGSPSTSSAPAPHGKQKEPTTGTTRSIFQRSSRQGSISSFVNVASNGKEKERECEPAARRPSATPSFFAKAFGSNSDAKRDAALGLRRGSAEQWMGGGIRRSSEASVASSSSSGSRSASRPSSTRPSSTRQRASTGSTSAAASTFPSARGSPQPGDSPIASTSSLSLEAFDKIPVRSSRSRSSAPMSNFGPDIFPTARRPDSIISSRSSSSHPFPPLARTLSSSTSATHSSQQSYQTNPVDFDSAMDALFDSQDRPERPRSNLSRPSPRSSLGGFRPISVVFPSRPSSSIRTGSIRTMDTGSSLRHSASLASIPDAAREVEEPPAVPPLPPSTVSTFPSAPRPPSPSIAPATSLLPPAPSPPSPPSKSSTDLYAGPSETQLQFDEASQSYLPVSDSSRGPAEAVKQAEGGVEALVASIKDMGTRRPSGTSLSRKISKQGRNRKGSEASVENGDAEMATRKARNREITADSLTSEGSFARMSAGPSPEQLMGFGGGSSAPMMDRDANATLRPDSMSAPVATSIDDIINSYRPSPSDDSVPKSNKSWGIEAPTDRQTSPAVSAVPFPRSTPRRSSASSSSPPPSAPLFSATLPALRYGSTTSVRSSSPPPRRSLSPPPPVPTTRSPPGSPPPVAVEFSPPVIDPAASSQPTRIKTIDEIIGEHGGKSSPIKSDEQTPAQVLAAAARSRATSDGEDEPRSSVDSVSAELWATLELQRALERQDEEVVERTRKTSKSSLTKSFSLRLPRSASSPTGLDFSSGDKADTRSIKSNKSAYSLHGTPRAPSPAAFSTEALAVERELATLLKSSRLTRIITLRRPPNQGLNVSLADVGSATGHPVIVFLGLGCVRYLVALYEEIAEAFGLRLICLDRWGLGRTGEVADDRRGFVEWSLVVEEVAEQLQLKSYSLLAHSAGSPYALATALHSPTKVHGSIHLLAPWVSTSADSLAGAYKMLRYIPSGVIKSAQNAEWKMQAWRLGKPPTITHAPVGYDQATGSMLGDAEGGGGLKSRPSKSFLGGLFGGGSPNGDRSARSSTDACDGGSLRSPTSRSRRNSYFAVDALSTPPPSNRLSIVGSSSLSPRTVTPSGLPMPGRRESMVSSSSTSSTLNRRDSQISLSSPTSPTSVVTPSSATLSGTDLANGLLRASYAESLRGGTSDLMVILERTSKPWGFKYSDVDRRIKVWHGDKDERISMSSVKGLEAEMKACQVKVVEGADHSLMTNGRVMIEVLESIAAEVRG